MLAYKLAELRQRLVATSQIVSGQVHKPTAHPILRWLAQCFEGIDLHHIQLPDSASPAELLVRTTCASSCYTYSVPHMNIASWCSRKPRHEGLVK